MKAIKMILVAVMIGGLVATGCASKQVLPEPTPGASSDLPEPTRLESPPDLPTDYQVAGANQKFQIINTSDKGNSVTFQVPVLQVQIAEQELTNPNWQLFASHAWTDGEDWYLEPFAPGAYEIDTQKTKEGNLEARMKFSNRGLNWFWVRIWGKDRNSNHWLWIEQESQFCRDDTTGNPGYEFMVNPANGKFRPIGPEYQTRP